MVLALQSVTSKAGNKRTEPIVHPIYPGLRVGHSILAKRGIVHRRQIESVLSRRFSKCSFEPTWSVVDFRLLYTTRAHGIGSRQVEVRDWTQ